MNEPKTTIGFDDNGYCKDHNIYLCVECFRLLRDIPYHHDPNNKGTWLGIKREDQDAKI